MTEDDYKLHIDKLISDFALHPERYQTADQIVEHLQPDHTENLRAMQAANQVLKIRPEKFITAMNRRRLALEKKARADQVVAMLGLMPRTEREFVTAYTNSFNKRMDYGGNFHGEDGKVQPMYDVLESIQLTASDLGLTKAPHSLTDKNLERALNEWFRLSRIARQEEIWASIARLPADFDAQTLDEQFLGVCAAYITMPVPAVAAAAIKDVIYQVKRKMRRLPIKRHRCVVLFGNQDTGKSFFWNLLKAVISDLCKDVPVTALVADNQLDLLSYFLIDFDEMTAAEKADINRLKTILTGSVKSTRKYFTQMMADVKIMATCVGSTNLPLHTLIKDPTGMRRYVQLSVRTRPEIEPHWPKITGFNWTALWQSVDEQGDSPLDIYLDVIQSQQERMREKNRVETWIMDFEYSPRHTICTRSEAPDRVQYAAKELYKLFQQFEEQFYPGIKMALSTWGDKMKHMIGAGLLAEWEFYEHGHRCFYTYTPNNVIALAPPKNTSTAR